MLCFLLTDDNSDIRSAFPFSVNGFFSNLLFVPKTLSAMLGVSSVNIYQSSVILTFKKYKKIIKISAPRTDPILIGDRLDVDRIFEISFVFVWAFSFSKGTDQVYVGELLEVYVGELLYLVNIYLNSLLFETF